MDPAVGCPVSRDQVPWGAIRFWKCLASSTYDQEKHKCQRHNQEYQLHICINYIPPKLVFWVATAIPRPPSLHEYKYTK